MAGTWNGVSASGSVLLPFVRPAKLDANQSCILNPKGLKVSRNATRHRKLDEFQNKPLVTGSRVLGEALLSMHREGLQSTGRLTKISASARPLFVGVNLT